MSTPVQSLFDLTGQVALVTGGSRGLGLQIAEALGEAGAKIMLTSRKAADLIKASTSMGKLAHELREQGKKYGNASFKQKADAVAKKVGTLTKAKTPSKTVDTNTYNDAVDDLTSYCGQMFPSATKKSA